MLHCEAATVIRTKTAHLRQHQEQIESEEKWRITNAMMFIKVRFEAAMKMILSRIKIAFLL